MYPVIFFAILGSLASQRQCDAETLPFLLGFEFKFRFRVPNSALGNSELANRSFLFRERQLLDVQEIQLDRRRAPEDRDHNLEHALVRVDLFDLTGETAERARQ